MSDLKVLIGNNNNLEVIEQTENGFYLEGFDDGDILLPKKYATADLKIGDRLDVFVYLDSEDRLIATTEKPLAEVGDFACLEVVSIEKVGAFLNWGLTKDLFLPYREQTRDIRVGDNVVVAVYIDSSGRIAASMRVQKFLSEKKAQYVDGQKVELFISAKTDLGYKAIINNEHIGVLYANEVFQNLNHGQRISGYIKKMRDDGKIDLILQPPGNLGAEDLGQKILDLLKKENGFLKITDKTDPEKIYELFGVSKKKFKMALGGLYKKRLISISDDGVRLLS